MPHEIDDVAVDYDIVMRVETGLPDKSSANQAQIVGVSVGGIHFDPMTAEVYNNDRNSGWNYEALTVGAAANIDLPGALGYLGSDCNNAHVQPNGIFHYFVTDDYPFIQRCVWGEPTSDALHAGP